MKKTLLFAKSQYCIFGSLLMFCLCFNYGWSQNLMLNGTCDDWTFNTGDNADAYDMTPNNDIQDNTGATVPSPYQPIWDNDALEDALEIKYLGMPGTLDEQPGSTSGGAGGTRGVKLYDDGNPVITGSSRRLYQKVLGLTIGNDYTFSVDSRSEAMGTPSEVYILNTEITDENGIDTNGAADASVDAFLSITNDYDAVGDVFTNSTLSFTASNTFAVVYVRSLNSIDGNTEVFYDNFSLVEDATASVEDVFASNLKIYPNPVNNFITIESKNIKIASVEIYSLLGQKVMSDSQLKNNKVDVSDISNGLYLLKVNAENGGSSTRKIVIE
ncbi:T9SS type A sorting domain-containing protein [Sabulilitoribacter multivorans]|uniref:T9SS type A sorting domain-containing protein n=1 Tax=Flaviramulus multivorans TaxID=1304750 RepID=A0ABS9IIZ0_9FLAO|nr:T9SS type A sorting domain-containing protein [Flaviramulus multivorans]MCF7560628.1 T9SS type A sorting domain-containing protein [Flaviramulus multivorans]